MLYVGLLPLFSYHVFVLLLLAKSKWDKLEHYISSVVMRKQTISSMEAEMDLHISKREELSKKLENYSKRLDDAINRDQVSLS